MRKFLNKDFVFLTLLTILYLKLETYLAYKGMFAYTYDQGRDLLEASRIIFEKDITLIGPTTGLPGIFYGPWWYYLLSLPVLFFQGNPTYVAIFFTMIGLATSISLFLFLKRLTKSFYVSAFISYLSLVSPMWMLSPTFIWSPTLVPILMVLFYLSFLKINKTQKAIYYFSYGLTSQLILNGEVAFGVMVTLWIMLSAILFRKYLLNKNLIFTFFGMALVWVPQIIFEIRNNLLETRATISYILDPKVYGDANPIHTRFIQRLNTNYDLFTDSFFKGNDLLSILFLLFLAVNLIYFYKNKSTLENRLFINYLCSFFIFSILLFSVFKDRIWDYYLIGIPITILIFVAIILNFSKRLILFKSTTIAFSVVIIIINFPYSIFSAFNEYQATDGGSYINAKRVMDYIAEQKPKAFSLYVFSPAIFDPPFDYLVYWYEKKNILEKPEDKSNSFYLIIREYSSKKYLKSGWYGDKTKDASRLIEKHEFIGDIVVEKHEFIR